MEDMQLTVVEVEVGDTLRSIEGRPSEDWVKVIRDERLGRATPRSALASTVESSNMLTRGTARQLSLR